MDTVIDAAHEAGKLVCMLAMDAGGIHRWKAAKADVIIAGIDATYLINGSESAQEVFGIVVSRVSALAPRIVNERERFRPAIN